MHKFLILFLVAILSVPCFMSTTGNMAYAIEQTSKKKKKQQQRNNKSKKKKKKQTIQTPQTSAEAQQQHDATEEEIRRTQQEIDANNRKIAHQLNQLRLLDAEILESERTITEISLVLNRLTTQIDSLSSVINSNEKKLANLRNNYLKAIKQFRLNKGKTSTLAFIFSAKNFSQAYRRFRYLREFSRWRANKAAQIMALQSQLIIQKELLSQTQSEKNVIFNKEIVIKENLTSQQNKQQILVGELRKNGEALQSHLSAKQTEANNLRSQISVLIAEEERKLREEEEQRRREEEQRRIDEENARLAEQQRIEAEQQNQLESTSQQSTDNKKKKQTQEARNYNYADARGRQRRGRQNSQTTGNMPAQSSIILDGFEAAKGTLPKPVAGSFKIVNQFGRHAHPDIPNVEYDNPGIDAEVAPGSFAQAVYPGKVSGVYMLKGFRTVIIVNHGKYYTVYANIDSPNVKSGDQVTQGQTLGKLFSDKDDNDRTIIHFEVWCSRDKLNPNEWIK